MTQAAKDHKTTVFNSAFLGFILVFSRILTNLVLLPTLTHTLGGTRFGLYILLLSLAEMVMLLELGFGAGVLRQLAHYRAEQKTGQIKELLGISSSFYTVMSGLIIFAGFYVLPFWIASLKLDPSVSGVALPAAQIALVDAVLIFWGSYFKAILIAHNRNTFINSVDLGWNFSVAIVLFALVSQHYEITWLLGGRLAINIVRLAVLAIKAMIIEPVLLSLPKLRITETLKQLMDVSSSQLITTLSIMLSHGLDSFILAAYLPIQYVGLYELIKRMLGTGRQLINKVMEIYTPIMIRQNAQNETNTLRNGFLRTGQFVGVISLIFYAVLIGFYPEIFKFFAQGSYTLAQSIPLFIVASICEFSGVMQMPASNYFFVSGRYRYLAGSSIITGVVNFILSWALVQQIGFIGPAMGTLIANVAQHQLSLVWVALKQLNITVSDYLIKTYGSLLFPALTATAIILVARTFLYYGLNFFAVFAVASLLISMAILTLWFKGTASDEEKIWMLEKFTVLKRARRMVNKTVSRVKRVGAA